MQDDESDKEQQEIEEATASCVAAATETNSGNNCLLHSTMTHSITHDACSKKKKGKYDDYESAPENAVYFLFDVETSGGKRNWDRIIAMSFLAVDQDGELLGSFSKKMNPGSVRIGYHTTRIHSKLIRIEIKC